MAYTIYPVQVSIWSGDPNNASRPNSVEALSVTGNPKSLAVPGIGPLNVQFMSWSANYGLGDLAKLWRVTITVDPADSKRIAVSAQYLPTADAQPPSILSIIDILVFCS